MSTNKDRIDLATAQAVAGEVREMLALFCHRIEIAGSVRRQSPTVGDIELLAEPKTSERFTDFFSQIMEIENHLDGYLRTLLDQGTLAPRLDGNGRSALGPRYKRLLYRGFPFDLFSCIPPAQWGLLLAIRTGPGEFSHQLVTPRHMGGLLPDGYSVREGQLWHGFESVPVHDEQTLFGILGMDYIPPADRREDWTR